MAFGLEFRWFGGHCGDKALFSQEFRRLRAATYFAHGGKVDLLCPWRQSRQNATGDGSDEHFVLIVAFPRTPFYEGRQLGGLGSRRKGAGGSADWFPLYYRCR